MSDASKEILPVEVSGLVARYGEKVVLDGVDMSVRPGEIRVILGGSGCGKSTLLRNVIGLLKPYKGTVRLLGTDLTVADEPEREALFGRIGMLFQGSALLNSISVRENVALPLRERFDLPEAVLIELTEMKLGLVGLAGKGGLLPSELSGGMKKRAGLARAMALDPEILFCDEPGAGLDPISSVALDELLLGLRDRFGMTLVVVTHELSSIRMIADRVTMLDQGKVIADGPLEEVEAMDQPLVRAFFDRTAEAGGASGDRASIFRALTEGS